MLKTHKHPFTFQVEQQPNLFSGETSCLTSIFSLLLGTAVAAGHRAKHPQPQLQLQLPMAQALAAASVPLSLLASPKPTRVPAVPRSSQIPGFSSSFKCGAPLFSRVNSGKKKMACQAHSTSIKCEQGTTGSNGLDVWLGRLAMLGFATAITVEVATGKGLLEVVLPECCCTIAMAAPAHGRGRGGVQEDGANIWGTRLLLCQAFTWPAEAAETVVRCVAVYTMVGLGVVRMQLLAPMAIEVSIFSNPSILSGNRINCNLIHSPLRCSRDCHGSATFGRGIGALGSPKSGIQTCNHSLNFIRCHGGCGW